MRSFRRHYAPLLGQRVSPDLSGQIEFCLKQCLDSMGIPAQMMTTTQDPVREDLLHSRITFSAVVEEQPE